MRIHVLSARERATQLASTGQYASWADIAAKLVREGYGRLVVQGVGTDQRLKTDLHARIVRARTAAGLSA